MAAIVIPGTVAFSFAGAFGLSILVWQHLIGLHLHWLVLPITFVILVAVGSDYNLLLIARVKEEIGAGQTTGLHTGLIRALGSTGGVVTSAGLVFAFTMLAMLTSDLRTIGQVGSTVCIGLLLDTLIVRSFIVPCSDPASRAMVLVADAGALAPPPTQRAHRLPRSDAMNLSTHTTGLGLWGLLMFVALGFEVVFASLAFVYVRRLLALRALPGCRRAQQLPEGAAQAAQGRTDDPATR